MKQIKLSLKDKRFFGYETRECEGLFFNEFLFFKRYQDLFNQLDSSTKKKINKLTNKSNNFLFFFNGVLEYYLKHEFAKPNYKLRLNEDPPYWFYHVEYNQKHFVLAPHKSYLVINQKNPELGDIQEVATMFLKIYPELIKFYEFRLDLFAPGFHDMVRKHVQEAKTVLEMI